MKAESELLKGLLKDVSRSFFLTLRVLPGAVRDQIGLAYLLARATDTIADTEIVPVSERLERLCSLRDRILGTRLEPLEFGELGRCQGKPGERLLLERIEEAILLLASFEERDQRWIREVLQTITGGQHLDLERFGAASREGIVALERAEELDDYTYRVAGCVGEFWTKICRAHLFPDFVLEEAAFVEDGIRFGKGLQLVNVLRDLANDLRQGRCYLPASELAEAGLRPEWLLDPEKETAFRPVYERWLVRATEHLEAGWRYTRTLPRGCVRVRLACTWPIEIGMETLDKLRVEPVLNPEHRVKVTRGRVWYLVMRSLLLFPWRG